jgi:hypothetical protein
MFIIRTEELYILFKSSFFFVDLYLISMLKNRICDRACHNFEDVRLCVYKAKPGFV